MNEHHERSTRMNAPEIIMRMDVRALRNVRDTRLSCVRSIINLPISVTVRALVRHVFENEIQETKYFSIKNDGSTMSVC